jgi:hypothetical protein
MLWHIASSFQHDLIGYYWLEPRLHFKYRGLSWVRPWPGDGMYLHFVLLAGAAAALMVGRWTRSAAWIFSLGFTYLFLLDQARYLNHSYLISLVAFLLAITPAHRVWSLDRVYARREGVEWPPTVPVWAVWLLRFQIGVVYAFGGLAKLDAGWLGAESLRRRFADAGGPLIGWIVEHNLVQVVFSWGGLLFDLLIVPLLLWRRTRLVAFAAAVLFHVANSQLFTIGVFPWLAIAATTMFFSPDWPHRLVRRIGLRPTLWMRPRSPRAADAIAAPPPSPRPMSRPAFACLTAYVVVQLLVPLRHYLYPGDVAWNQRGYRFSWHMMLHGRTGAVRLRVVMGTDTTIVFPSQYMASWQARPMIRHPGMILQFAHHVADEFSQGRADPVRVYADAVLSVDGRPPSLLIDPKVDLASKHNTFGRQRWILDEGQVPYDDGSLSD